MSEQLHTTRQIQTTCLLILTTIALGAALFWLKPVLVPFVLAVFLTYCLTPIIELLVRHLKAPTWVAAIITLFLAGVLLLLLVLLVWGAVAQLMDNADMYRSRVSELVDRMVTWIPANHMGMDLRQTARAMFVPSQSTISSLITGTLTQFATILTTAGLVTIFMFFLLLGRISMARHITGLWGEVEQSIRSYIVAKVVISAVTGGLQALILMFFGVPFALFFGLAGALFNFIPNFGPIIAVVLPIPVILLEPDLSMTAMTLAIGLPMVIHFVSGNVVEPKIMGQSLDLHPVSVLIALVFFGMIWGLPGMFLAAPLTAIIKICLSKMPITRPAADVMAGKFDIFLDSHETPATTTAGRNTESANDQPAGQ